MDYTIQRAIPLTHLIQIQLEINVESENHVELKLPFWRPGRYEAANYAKNIKKIHFTNEKGEKLGYEKTSHSTWNVEVTSNRLIAHYEYYAHQLDAGNSWYSEDQLYINFINCLLYSENHLTEACQVRLDLPDDYQIACGLKKMAKNTLKASSYHELVDSPLIASADLTKIEYTSHGLPFTIWFQGEHGLNEEKVVNDFKKFTGYQIDMIGEFPEQDYHFLNEITSYKHYHGVEHANSTVICIGPGSELNTQELYSEFLGVSSHELFHAWNIIKIRPEEMMPYNFGAPVTFTTGYVAEGFTTYYGDLFLVRSSVFDIGWYFNELNKLFNRHFHNYGRLNNSVIDSSIDLWIDGYQQSAPHKKSSIYVEGAVIALTLDLLIRRNSNNKKCLDDVMRQLWKEFGKTGKGYSLKDIQRVCEEVNGGKLLGYFEDYVYGVKDKYELLQGLLESAGCTLSKENNVSILEGKVGLKLLQTNDGFKVVSIAPYSLAEQYFSVKDQILKINGQPVTQELAKELNERALTFEIERAHEKKEVQLILGDQDYFPNHVIKKQKSPSNEQEDFFKSWLGCEF